MLVSAPLWGVLSDRYGRKVMVSRAMFGGAVANGLMGWARSIPQLVILRAIQGALAGTVAAAATLVSASAPKERAGRVLGLLQMAIYTGAALGPLLGGALAARMDERFTFWVTGLLLLVAGLVVTIFAEEPGSSGTDRGQKDVAANTSTNWAHRLQAYLAPVLCSAPLGGILLVDLLTRLGSRVIIPMMPLFVETISSPGPAAVSSAGLVTATGAGAAALGSLYFGRLGDSAGHRWVLTFCIVFAGIGCIPQFFVRSMGSLVALQVGVGLALGGAVALLTASLAELAPDGKMGIVYGVNMSVVCVANIVGPMLGGSLSALMGLRAVFLAAASIFAVAGFLAFQLRAKHAY
jgi:DHA1 family multidrug resistance protein-like MFS transporter